MRIVTGPCEAAAPGAVTLIVTVVSPDRGGADTVRAPSPARPDDAVMATICRRSCGWALLSHAYEARGLEPQALRSGKMTAAGGAMLDPLTSQRGRDISAWRSGAEPALGPDFSATLCAEEAEAPCARAPAKAIHSGKRVAEAARSRNRAEGRAKGAEYSAMSVVRKKFSRYHAGRSE
jgi:hypothetical protein